MILSEGLRRFRVGRTGPMEFVALAVIGLFMAALGAFETRPGRPLAYAYWLTVMIGGGLVAALVEPLIWRIPPLARRPAMLAVAQVFAMTPPVAVVVFLTAWLMERMEPSVGRYLALLPSVFLVNIGVVLIAVLIRRGQAALLPARPPPEGVAPAAIRAKLPPRLARARLLAAEAEDHYLRVRTDAGDALILMRFADALEALKDAPGMQTHRSWWVARAAVEHARFARGRGELALVDGTRVPVSRGFAAAVKAADWAA